MSEPHPPHTPPTFEFTFFYCVDFGSVECLVGRGGESFTGNHSKEVAPTRCRVVPTVCRVYG